MKKAYLTVVVTGTTAATVLEHLKDADLGVVDVLTEADINISEKDISSLTNEIWLHEPEVFAGSPLFLVEDDDATEGRELTAEELRVVKDYGVCVGFKTIHPDAAEYGQPIYAIHDEAALAEMSQYGFEVAAELDTNFENGDDGAEKRWIRIAMPAWFAVAP